MMRVDVYKGESASLTEGLTSVIAQLEREKVAIEHALAALRDFAGIERAAPNGTRYCRICDAEA
jgi:hypothetical protein